MPSATMTDQATETPRSPSPPPVQPTALTPGPRATRFVEVVDGALASTLKAISYDSFAVSFPTTAQNAPEALKSMHTQVTSRFEAFAKTEFEAVFAERSVIASLNSLEDLLAAAASRKARAATADPASAPLTPPHELPPGRVLAAHLAAALASQQSVGNARLQNTQARNQELWREIAKQRAEIEALMRGLEEAVEDLEGAVGGLSGEGGVGGDLRRETREVEVDMEGI